MNRRQALKNLGLGGGALVATPTIISLLQSCGSGAGPLVTLKIMPEAKMIHHLIWADL